MKKLKKKQKKCKKYEDAKKRRGIAEDTYNTLKDEYRKSMNLFGSAVTAEENGEQDPFSDPRFVAFISQMSEKGWNPQKVRELNIQLEELRAKDAELTQIAADLQQQEADISKQVTEKRKTIIELEEQLKQLAQDLEANTEEVRERPEFTHGAPHIIIEEEEYDRIESDQTAIKILFREFSIAPAYVGKNPSKIFLVVDFFDNQSLETDMVNPTGKMFNSPMLFIAKNDFILKEYIEKGAVPVQLCRLRDGSNTPTVVGTAELNLLPIIDHVNQFTTVIKIWSDTDKAVGTVAVEVTITTPLKG